MKKSILINLFVILTLAIITSAAPRIIIYQTTNGTTTPGNLTDTWNTTAEMRAAINNTGEYNITINASNVNNPPWITTDTDNQRLNEIVNPNGNTAFLMNQFNLSYTFTTGNIEIEQLGAFVNDALHIHQNTGNPSAGSDLLHLEATDADVILINATGARDIVAYFLGNISIDNSKVCTANNGLCPDTWNTTAQIFSVTNGYLNNLQTNITNLNTSIQSNLTNKAGLGSCPAGQYVNQTTATGVTCQTDATGSGATNYYLANNIRSNSLSTLIGVFNFSLSANKRYFVKCDFLTQSNVTTTGLKINHTCSYTPTAFNTTGVTYTSATATSVMNTNTCGGADMVFTGTTSTTLSTPLQIWGVWETNSTTALTVNMFLGSEVVNTWATIIKGSKCTAEATN